jgi:hypothetical protein
MSDGRSWVLPPMTGTRLTSNDRPHFHARAAATREWRKLGWGRAREARIPRLARARVDVQWLPSTAAVHDPSNAHPMVKALVDGICLDAGVLADDSAEFLVGPHVTMGERFRPAVPGRGLATLRVTVTEITGSV